MNMKLTSVALAALMACGSAFAANTGNSNSTFGETTNLVEKKGLGVDIDVKAGADIDILGIAKEGRDTYEQINLRNAFVTLKANIGAHFVAKLTTELNLLLLRDGRGSISFNHIERFVKEAQIIIKDIGGIPFAILVGKGEVPFAQNYSRMPMHDAEGIGERLFKEDQKYMVAIRLDKRLIKFLDSIEVSVFETDPRRDLSLGSVDGVSVRVTKRLFQHVTATGSWMMKGNGDTTNVTENRVTLGVVFDNGDWAAWAEGMYMQDNWRFPNSEFALIAGIAKRLGFAEIAAEFQWLENERMSIGVGANIMVARGVKFGPQVTYVMCDDNATQFKRRRGGCREDHWRFGGRISIRTDNSSAPAKRRSLGGGKYQPLVPMN